MSRLSQSLATLGMQTRAAWSISERGSLIARANADPCCQALVVAGGDGTVAAVIQERPSVPLAVLPSGTENLFANHAGLGNRPERIARAIAAGSSRTIDLGQVQAGPRFSLMAGFGFDADVVSRHHNRRIGQHGNPQPTNRAAYVEPILRSSLTYPFPPIRVHIEDPGREETISGTTVLLFNLPRYALGLPFAPDARDDDGLLDLVVFQKPGPFHALHYLWLVFRRLHLKRRGTLHRAARRFRIEVDTPVPVQLDGDPGGQIEPGKPWTIACLPQALQLIRPV